MVDTAPTPRWDAISRDGNDRLSIDGIYFWLTTTDYHTPSTRERFVLMKNRAILDSYREVFQLIPSVRNALELVFFQGASTVLYDRLLLPERFVAVDHMPEAPFLEAYRTDYQRATLVPYYGVAQQDIAARSTIAQREFSGRNLDLVIDDASHEYEATRGAFEVFRPFVRAGGVYVIEDWGWATGLGSGKMPSIQLFRGRRYQIWSSSS